MAGLSLQQIGKRVENILSTDKSISPQVVVGV